jgi:hypothetical protein
MTESRTTSQDLVDILSTHQYAPVALIATKKKDYELAKGALEKLAEDMHLDNRSKGFREAAYVSDEGVERAAMEYAGEFNNAFYNCKILNLRDYFLEAAPLRLGKTLSAHEKVMFEARTDKYKNETLSQIKEKLDKAKETLKKAKTIAPNNPLEISQAYETLSLYANISNIFEGLLAKNVNFLEQKAKETANVRSADEIKQIALGGF